MLRMPDATSVFACNMEKKVRKPNWNDLEMLLNIKQMNYKYIVMMRKSKWLPPYQVFSSYKLDMYCMTSETKINEIECWHPLIV